MKKYFTSALLVFVVASAPVLAQSKATTPSTARPASIAKPAVAAKSTTAKPAAKTTTAKPVATAKTTARPAAKSVAKPTTAKPAPAPKAAPAPAVESAAVADRTPEPFVLKSKTTSSSKLFGKGSTAVNLGVGLGLGYGYGLGGLHSTPAMSLSVDHGFVDNVGPGTIGIGGLVGYKGYGWKSGGYKGTWSNIIVAARGTYHYDLLNNPKLDTYAGLSLGVRHERYSDNADTDYYYSKASSTYITSGIFVGARYFFSDNIGAFGELGYDMSYLKLGVSAKF